jgi:hypothetical protein
VQVQRHVEPLEPVEQRGEPGVVEKDAVRAQRAVDQRADQAEIADGAVELVGPGLRVRGGQGGEAGEPVRVRAHRPGQPVVGLAGAGQPFRAPERLRGRRGVRDDLQVDAAGVHVGQTCLTEIAEPVVHPLAPRG